MRAYLAFLVLATALVAPSTSPAQDLASREEMRAIREQIGVSDATPVVLASSSDLPAEPLRVYLAVGLDAAARNYFESVTREWNKKHAKKYRTIELVGDLASANLVYVHFERPDLTRSETQTTTSTVQVADPNGGPARNEVVPSTSTTTVFPQYSYWLVRSGSGYGVLDRQGGYAPQGSAAYYHETVWTLLQRRLGYKGSPTRHIPFLN